MGGCSRPVLSAASAPAKQTNKMGGVGWWRGGTGGKTLVGPWSRCPPRHQQQRHLPEGQSHAPASSCNLGFSSPRKAFTQGREQTLKLAIWGCCSADFSGCFFPRLSRVLRREMQGCCFWAFSHISPGREDDSVISACLGGSREIKKLLGSVQSKQLRWLHLAIALIHPEPVGRSSARSLSGCFSPSALDVF